MSNGEEESSSAATANDSGCGIKSQQPSSKSITCRVAIIGAQRARVAKVTALLHADKSRSNISTISLILSEGETAAAEIGAAANIIPTLPDSIPSSEITIEFLPIVATFDSYEDESGTTIRYLVKLEYHGPKGTLVKGKSLAPFFDDMQTNDSDVDNENEVENYFPGISAVAIGCGIESTDDVTKIRNVLETMSNSCSAQLNSKVDCERNSSSSMIIECIKPNADAEYTTMKEEIEAYRNLNEDEKKQALQEGTIGPGKMANFVYNIAKQAVRQRFEKELKKYEQSLLLAKEEDNEKGEEQVIEVQQPTIHQQQIIDSAVPDTKHIPDPTQVRYACKICRSVLFGIEDLEDPPHTASQHNFQKKGYNNRLGTSSCQAHFISQPLPCMVEQNDCSMNDINSGCMEGKLHCYKCHTKVGHYSWTGSQCSCGTWVTPAIMVPMSKVDEMNPITSIANSGVNTTAANIDVHLQNLSLDEVMRDV